jgi:hypothetical protein
MRRILVSLLTLTVLALFLSACEGYSQTGVRTKEHQDGNGGSREVRLNKANGSATEEIEIDYGAASTLEADVTLSVEKGTYKIELLEDDRVTLTLEARDGQAVSGHGQMSVTFSEARYRVTAVEAEGVEYTIEYSFR